MIEDNIREEAKKFSSFWNGILKDCPELNLDGTWPSIGIVDKILFPLRGKERFDKNDTIFIKGAAAYIGIIAHSCWSKYSGVDCKLINVGDNVGDYLLEASGGKFLKDNQKFAVLMCRTLETSLKNSNKEISYFADDTRYFSFEDNFLSSLASGIVSGLCPQGQGPWAKLDKDMFAENLIKCAKVIAQSSVDYYTAKYAGEPIGGQLDLYYPHLVLPPLKSNEPHIAARATAALINHITLKKLNSAQIKALIKNLCFNPDDTISTAAFIVACCVYKSPPDWLLFLSNARGLTNPLLKPSLAIARKALEETDFIEDYENGDLIQTEAKLLSEYNLGFLPLYYLQDIKALKLPEDFLYFIAWTSAKRAHDLLDSYCILSDLPPELALQLAFLRINCGMLKEAEDIINNNFGATPPNEMELKFRYFEISSLIATAKGQKEKRVGLMEEAILTGSSNPIRFATVGNLLAREYLQTERHQQAVVLSEQITEKCPWWISAHLSKLIGLLALRKNEEIEFILDDLRPYFIKSNQLFSFFKAYKLNTKS